MHARFPAPCLAASAGEWEVPDKTKKMLQGPCFSVTLQHPGGRTTLPVHPNLLRRSGEAVDIMEKRLKVGRGGKGGCSSGASKAGNKNCNRYGCTTQQLHSVMTNLLLSSTCPPAPPNPTGFRLPHCV